MQVVFNKNVRPGKKCLSGRMDLFATFDSGMSCFKHLQMRRRYVPLSTAGLRTQYTSYHVYKANDKRLKGLRKYY